MPKRVKPYPLPVAPTFDQSCQVVIQYLREVVERLHDFSLKEYGGLPGILDDNKLHSAVSRPFSTYDQGLLYPSGLLQAAALLQSLSGHCFVDVNKRTALNTCLYFLEQCGYWHKIPFLSVKEFQELKQLVLLLASEGEGKNPQRSTVEEIAQALEDILGASRGRPMRPRRRGFSADYLRYPSS